MPALITPSPREPGGSSQLNSQEEGIADVQVGKAEVKPSLFASGTVPRVEPLEHMRDDHRSNV